MHSRYFGHQSLVTEIVLLQSENEVPYGLSWPVECMLKGLSTSGRHRGYETAKYYQLKKFLGFMLLMWRS